MLMYGSQKDAGEVFSRTRCKASATLGICLNIGSFSIKGPNDESLAVSVVMHKLVGIDKTTSPFWMLFVTFNPKPVQREEENNEIGCNQLVLKDLMQP